MAILDGAEQPICNLLQKANCLILSQEKFPSFINRIVPQLSPPGPVGKKWITFLPD